MSIIDYMELTLQYYQFNDKHFNRSECRNLNKPKKGRGVFIQKQTASLTLPLYLNVYCLP